MGCSIIAQRYALQSVRNALNVLRNVGYGPLDEPFQKVAQLQDKMLAGLGLTRPKWMTMIKALVGLSPGAISVWLDSDSGWFTEAREKPGAPPVYKHVTDEVAMAILKGELTHELESELMTPDPYLGE